MPGRAPELGPRAICALDRRLGGVHRTGHQQEDARAISKHIRTNTGIGEALHTVRARYHRPDDLEIALTASGGGPGRRGGKVSQITASFKHCAEWPWLCRFYCCSSVTSLLCRSRPCLWGVGCFGRHTPGARFLHASVPVHPLIPLPSSLLASGVRACTILFTALHGAPTCLCWWCAS
jgi:hypothetical protein